MKNKVTLEGIICGKERPAVKFYPNGDKFLRFSVVWNGKIKKKRVSSFFNILLLGADAEEFDSLNCWVKGRRVQVSGTLYAWKFQFGIRTEIACKKLDFIEKDIPAAKVDAPKVEAVI